MGKIKVPGYAEVIQGNLIAPLLRLADNPLAINDQSRLFEAASEFPHGRTLSSFAGFVSQCLRSIGRAERIQNDLDSGFLQGSAQCYIVIERLCLEIFDPAPMFWQLRKPQQPICAAGPKILGEDQGAERKSNPQIGSRNPLSNRVQGSQTDTWLHHQYSIGGRW
jgi:hypothetical protein